MRDPVAGVRHHSIISNVLFESRDDRFLDERAANQRTFGFGEMVVKDVVAERHLSSQLARRVVSVLTMRGEPWRLPSIPARNIEHRREGSFARFRIIIEICN